MRPARANELNRKCESGPLPFPPACRPPRTAAEYKTACPPPHARNPQIVVPVMASRAMGVGVGGGAVVAHLNISIIYDQPVLGDLSPHQPEAGEP